MIAHAQFPRFLLLGVLLFACPVGLFAGQGASEKEPNNSRDLADTVGETTINGILDDGDTEDWFKLTGQEGSRASFTIIHANGADFDISIYSGDTLAGTASGTSSGDSVTADIPGTGYVKVSRYSGSGPYTVSIAPAAAAAATTPVASTSDFGAGPDEREPNDTREQADSISGLTLSGALATGADVDWFRLQGQEGVRPTIEIFTDDNADIGFSVYSGESWVGGTEDGLSTTIVGQAYLQVSNPWSGTGGTYRIQITPGTLGNSEREPNDTRSQADKAPNPTIDGEISTPGDVDWFVFTVEDLWAPEFILISHDPGFDVDMEIYQEDTLLQSLTGTAQVESVITDDITGKAYIRVFSGGGKTGKYSIEVWEDDWFF